MNDNERWVRGRWKRQLIDGHYYTVFIEDKDANEVFANATGGMLLRCNDPWPRTVVSYFEEDCDCPGGWNIEKEDIGRILACVNACRGLSTEWLEKHHLGDWVERGARE